MEQTRNAAIQVCFITKGKSGIMVAEELESYNTSTGQASRFQLITQYMGLPSVLTNLVAHVGQIYYKVISDYRLSVQ